MTTDPQTARYRHRTTEVEAVQWTGSNADQLRAFCGPDFDEIDPEDRTENPDASAAVRESKHGTWRGLEPGYWVVKIGEEFYEESPADFAAQFEPVPSAVPAPATDRAVVYREVADRLAADAERGEKEGFTRIYQRAAATKVREWADDGPLSPYYEHPECGFHWHGRDGMDIPIRDGEPVCPRCEIEQLREKHKASLRRADKVNNELMEEVQRYAIGAERPVLWSVYNRMHSRAAHAEAALNRVGRIARRLAAHAVGFKDVLDASDHGPWGRTVGADIAELIEALADQAAPAPAGAGEVPCPGFPDGCPTLIAVVPTVGSTHGGGLRCGCYDEKSTP